MDHIIYTAMMGARQTLDMQGVINNNLANTTTTGFRGQLMAVQAVNMASASGLETRISSMVTTPGSDFSTGVIHSTERDLDVAFNGSGWLAVQDSSGQEAYTRRGDLQVNENGLITSGSNPVIGEGGPVIVPLGATLAVGGDGTISAIGVGEDPDSLVSVARLKLVDPGAETLLRGEDGLFRTAPDQNGETRNLPQDENLRLVTGALEGSNVSPIASMVAMIDNARSYDMHMKVIETANENAQRANSLLSLQG